MMPVMRKPENTKNTSTPMKPPGRAFGKAWKFITSITAMALRPSISGRYFGEGEDNGPGIAADRGQRRQAAAPPSLAGLRQAAISHRTISHRNDLPKIRRSGVQNQL